MLQIKKRTNQVKLKRERLIDEHLEKGRRKRFLNVLKTLFKKFFKLIAI